VNGELEISGDSGGFQGGGFAAVIEHLAILAGVRL
jgi:hypothetical protein